MQIGALSFSRDGLNIDVTATDPWYSRIGILSKWFQRFGVLIDILSLGLAYFGIPTKLWITGLGTGITMVGLGSLGKRVEVETEPVSVEVETKALVVEVDCPDCGEMTEPQTVCENCGCDLAEVRDHA